MQHTPTSPRPIAAERSPWLRGALHVPGDEAVTQLALACGGLARGWSEIAGPLESAGTRAAAAALRALGAQLVEDEGVWHACGPGTGGLLEPVHELDLAGSRWGLELVMGLAGSHHFTSRFTGTPELSARRLTTLLDGLACFGVCVLESDGGRLPLVLSGPRIGLPAVLAAPASAATKAALLLAGLGVPGVTTVSEDRPTPMHAERMLQSFGAELTLSPTPAGGQAIELRGLTELRGRRVEVPADTGLAALGALAAAIVPGSELRMAGVLVNPTRTAILSALVAMGAQIRVEALRKSGLEEVADLVVRYAPLKGVALAAGHVAPLLAELPLLAVAAAFAEGETVLALPAGLPLETHARIAAIARGLAANGVACAADDERLAIRGSGDVRGGGRVLTTGDADLALAFLVLGMAANDQVTISDQSGIEERFPGFLDCFEDVGASFVRYSD